MQGNPIADGARAARTDRPAPRFRSSASVWIVRMEHKKGPSLRFLRYLFLFAQRKTAAGAGAQPQRPKTAHFAVTFKIGWNRARRYPRPRRPGEGNLGEATRPAKINSSPRLGLRVAGQARRPRFSVARAPEEEQLGPRSFAHRFQRLVVRLVPDVEISRDSDLRAIV